MPDFRFERRTHKSGISKIFDKVISSAFRGCQLVTKVKSGQKRFYSFWQLSLNNFNHSLEKLKTYQFEKTLVISASITMINLITLFICSLFPIARFAGKVSNGEYEYFILSNLINNCKWKSVCQTSSSIF